MRTRRRAARAALGLLAPGLLALGLAVPAATRAAVTPASAASASASASAPAASGDAASPGIGFDRRWTDPSVRPQDDLFRAANGRWLKTVKIPADKVDWGATREVRDRADRDVRVLVERLATGSPAPGSEGEQIDRYYRAYLDTAAIDAAGLAALQPWLDDIDAVRSPGALMALWGRLQGLATLPLEFGADADTRDPDHYIAVAWQSGLGLPGRDYYLKSGGRFGDARQAYLRYAETLLRESGAPTPGAQARAVLALERRIARMQWSEVTLRDPRKIYNPMAVAELERLAPGADWRAALQAGAMAGVERLSVAQPGYVRQLAAIVRETPLATWRAYLRVRLLDATAKVLPQPYRDAQFAYAGRALRGQQTPQPRWQLGIASLDEALGEAVGRLYVAQHFPPDHKARMEALVRRLFEAYAQSIDQVAWMSPATRDKAREKLAAYRVKIGYPERWRDYSGLLVREGDALGNLLRARRHDYERSAKRPGQPVDRDEWGMTPQTVNAYYNPLYNEIVFPAAILQPPFFDMAADDAYNYGATGSTIGHEISHGFDDEGSRYDGQGRLHDWWTEADRRAFDRLGQRLAAQYDRYQPLPGHHVNGQLTLGENIADLSGLAISYRAWQLSLAGQPAPTIDGTRGDERFFYGYAQSWRETMRDGVLLQQLTGDPHAPPETRVNGVVVNLDAFHRAFATRPGDKLYRAPAQRLRIW